MKFRIKSPNKINICIKTRKISKYISKMGNFFSLRTGKSSVWAKNSVHCSFRTGLCLVQVVYISTFIGRSWSACLETIPD